MVFGLIGLITGPLWGRKAWGVWWQWDVKLTLALVVWLSFVAYLLLRRFGGPGSEKLAAAVGIFGAVNIPFVYCSVNWWRTIHPKTSVVPTLGPGMRGTFWFSRCVHVADGADRRDARPPGTPSRAGQRSLSRVGGLNMVPAVPAGAPCCCGYSSQPDRPPTSLSAQEQPPKRPAQDEFVPLSELPPQEQLPAAPLLIAAYSVAWIVVAGYLFSIWRRMGRVEQELADVSRRLQQRRS